MIRPRVGTSIVILLVLAAMLAAAGSTAAQTAPAATAAPTVPAATAAPTVPAATAAPTVPAATPPNGQPASTNLTAMPVPIASGDLLDISVFDAPELTQEVRVDADGKVPLALIGSTKVAGLTAPQAVEVIAHELQEHNFVRQPQVNVLIKEYSSQGVSVMGEVQHPGVYQALGARSLLDVVSLAGGFTNLADSRVTIKHRNGKQENVTVQLKTDDARASLANDVQIYPGDLVLVPRAGIVYVMGAVNKPGGFVMQDNGQISVLQALAQAGGATNIASVNHALLLRRTANGYDTTQLRVDKMAHGEDGDLELHANDVLFVPTNRVKSGLQSVQNAASSLGSASIYAIVH